MSTSSPSRVCFPTQATFCGFGMIFAELIPFKILEYINLSFLKEVLQSNTFVSQQSRFVCQRMGRTQPFPVSSTNGQGDVFIINKLDLWQSGLKAAWMKGRIFNNAVAVDSIKSNEESASFLILFPEILLPLQLLLSNSQPSLQPPAQQWSLHNVDAEMRNQHFVMGSQTKIKHRFPGLQSDGCHSAGPGSVSGPEEF